jgi:hypothetical protein
LQEKNQFLMHSALMQAAVNKIKREGGKGMENFCNDKKPKKSLRAPA